MSAVGPVRDDPAMLVEEFMSRSPARIPPDATLGEAAGVVGTSGASDLMVVSDEGRFLGVLSEGDLLRVLLPDREQIVAAGGSLRDGFAVLSRMGRELAARPIDPLIIRDPLVVAPDDDLGVAIVTMVDRQIRRLPVVSDDRLVGTIARSDACRILIDD